MPNGLIGDEKLKFNDCGATLGKAGAIVQGTGFVFAGLGNYGVAGTLGQLYFDLIQCFFII